MMTIPSSSSKLLGATVNPKQGMPQLAPFDPLRYGRGRERVPVAPSLKKASPREGATGETCRHEPGHNVGVKKSKEAGLSTHCAKKEGMNFDVRTKDTGVYRKPPVSGGAL